MPLTSSQATPTRQRRTTTHQGHTFQLELVGIQPGRSKPCLVAGRCSDADKVCSQGISLHNCGQGLAHISLPHGNHGALESGRLLDAFAGSRACSHLGSAPSCVCEDSWHQARHMLLSCMLD